MHSTYIEIVSLCNDPNLNPHHTRRCATLCLIMVLCIFYPRCALIFQVLVALDISSHWMQMYSSLLHGENTHKVTDLAANPIMRLYYKRVGPSCTPRVVTVVNLLLSLSLQPVLFTFCAGNELFFAALYICNFTPGTQSTHISLPSVLPALKCPLIQHTLTHSHM